MITKFLFNDIKRSIVLILENTFYDIRKYIRKQGWFQGPKVYFLYHNSFVIYHDGVSIVNEPPYDKLMSQYTHVCTKREFG